MHTTVLGGLSCQVQELFVSDNCWQSPQTTPVLLCWIIRNLCSRSFELILKYVWVDIAQWHGYTVTDICWEKYHQLLTKTVSSLGQTGGRRGGEFEKYFQFRHSSPTVASSDAPTALNYKTCWFSNKVKIFNSVEPPNIFSVESGGQNQYFDWIRHWGLETTDDESLWWGWWSWKVWF